MNAQVLSVIQNYENLATESENHSRHSTCLDARLSTVSTSHAQADDPLGNQRPKPVRTFFRQLQLPPVASEVRTFRQVVNNNDEDEGIKYVDQLQVLVCMLNLAQIRIADWVLYRGKHKSYEISLYCLQRSDDVSHEVYCHVIFGVV